MELLFLYETLFRRTEFQIPSMGRNKTKDAFRIKREAGDVSVPLVCALMISSFIFGSLFWLNKHYENKTKEHLSAFTKDWNHLQKKYKD